MSRVAKSKITVPAGVEVAVKGSTIEVKGKGASLVQELSPLVTVVSTDGKVSFTPVDETRQADAMAGTLRQLVNNMVKGVTEGFEKKLTLVGVGYKAAAQGSKLNLNVGFSHPVDFEMPVGVTVTCPSPTEIVIKGVNRQVVGQLAAEIRAVRPPEPYKGKGVRYADEKVIIKETKKK